MDSRDVRLFAGLSRIAEIESLQERVLAIARDLVAWGLRKVDVRIIDDWNEVVRGEAGASPLSWEMAPDAAARRRLFQALAAFEEDGISQACGALLERSAPLFTIEGDARESCLLFLQLIAATRTVGLVIIDSGYPEPPDREIGALLRAYCDVAATLFDNERSAQRVRREAERSEVLARIGELTRRSLDRRTMLEHVVGHVREAFKAARCVFYERDKADPRLVHVVAIDDAKSIRAPFPKTHEMVPGGYLEAMLDRGQTVALESLSEAAPHERRVRSYGMRAVLAGPIHALEGPLDSAVSVHFARERTFDPVDLVLLRSITMHLGLALANARLFETERHARRRAEMLERNLRAIRGVQGESAILRFVTDTIVAEFGACGSAWSLRDGHFRCESASARKEALAPSYAVGTSVRVVSRHLAALQGEQVVLTRDEPELWSGVASKQAMIAPLFVEDRLWGFLSARIDLQPTATDEDRANFLRSLAAHTALAIANAHAMEKHRRYANERAALSESARTILTFNDPEALAATMTRIVLGLVGADRAEIYVPRDGFLRIVGSATFGGDAGYGESASEHMRVTLAYASGGTAVEDDGHTAIFALPSTDHVAGVLAVYRNVDDTAPFDENDIRLLESFSALLGLGLRNCELFEAQSSANAALRLSSEFKDDLLAMFTHDFKGPLTVIMGYAELLMERLSGEPRNDIATIYAQADRLVKLADDTMRLAQAQTAGFAVERESCDLAALLEEAIDGLGSGRVELVGSRAILALRILADRPRLLQALQNVIGNALKYSSERVQVRLEAGLGRAVVAVVDRGIGISTEDQSRIFARFARGRNAREQGIAGTGIGLYITRKIVEAHGGTIEVKSEEGQGSTFTISLPTAVGEHGTALGRRELTAPA